MFTSYHILAVAGHRDATPTFDHEEQLVADTLRSRGIPFQAFAMKQLHRRQLGFGQASSTAQKGSTTEDGSGSSELPVAVAPFVFGDLDCVTTTMKCLNMPPRQVLLSCYPPQLEDLLHRKVWRSTLREFLTASDAPDVFVKPLERQKLFTGFVAKRSGSGSWMGQLSNMRGSEPIFCSEAVEWLSEFRVYVLTGRGIIAMDCYSGDAAAYPLDQAVVDEAVGRCSDDAAFPVAFALDFGVMRRRPHDCKTTPQEEQLAVEVTALVEANDALGLGAYDGISAPSYTDMVLARWAQLLEERSMPLSKKD